MSQHSFQDRLQQIRQKRDGISEEEEDLFKRLEEFATKEELEVINNYPRNLLESLLIIYTTLNFLYIVSIIYLITIFGIKETYTLNELGIGIILLFISYIFPLPLIITIYHYKFVKISKIEEKLIHRYNQQQFKR